MNIARSKIGTAAGLPANQGHAPASSTEGRVGIRLDRLQAVILVALGWTGAGLFQAVPDMFYSFQWYELIGKLIEAWGWALLTPAILFIDRRLTWAHKNVVRLSAAHLMLSVPFSLIHTYLSAVLMFPLPEIWWNPFRSPEHTVYFYLSGWMNYCTFVGVLHAFKFYNRLLISQVELERVEKRLVESNLNALRLQLEPHFLFNTLNAISSEVVANPELSRDMIEDLGALLRRSLDCQGSTEIPLAQELALLDHYIAIQKLRFGDRIQIRVDVDPAVLPTLVPSMLLQPLIENAIRHGLEGKMAGGRVSVTAWNAGEHLEINVIDDGLGLPAGWRIETCTGLGIRVTRERLETLYAATGNYSFKISSCKGGGTKATVCIPIHREGSEEHGHPA